MHWHEMRDGQQRAILMRGPNHLRCCGMQNLLRPSRHVTWLTRCASRFKHATTCAALLAFQDGNAAVKSEGSSPGCTMVTVVSAARPFVCCTSAWAFF